MKDRNAELHGDNGEPTLENLINRLASCPKDILQKQQYYYALGAHGRALAPTLQLLACQTMFILIDEVLKGKK